MRERSRSQAQEKAAVPPGAITELLQAWSAGSDAARDDLFPLVYRELRRLAASYLRNEKQARLSLQPTALVNEAFLRLVDSRAPWRDRAHFFGVAAQAMRRILVDHARRRQALKRGQQPLFVTLDTGLGVAQKRDLDIVRLDDALTDLARLDRRQSSIVEMRFFGGLSIEETGEVLGLSAATVKREWTTAKAWIARELRRAAG